MLGIFWFLGGVIAWPAAASQSDSVSIERSRLEQAMERGARHLATVEYEEPFHYLLSDVAARRYDLPVLSGQHLRFDEMVAGTPRPDLRVFHRVMRHDAAVTEADLAAIPVGMDEMTSAALHCDRIPPGPGFRASLEANFFAGEYNLTHVLLALNMMDDNGCESPLGPDFEDEVARATLGLIDEDHRAVTDLEIEAAVFLAVSGRRHLVPREFVGGVLDAQMPDGGWKMDPDDTRSHWHASGLAVILLGEMLGEGEVAPWVIQGPR